MRAVVLASLLAFVAHAASAQIYPGSRPYVSQQPAYPQTKRTYDWQSGNSYTTTINPDGSARVSGYNYNNGSAWRSQIDANGNQRGTDSNGNYWNYNATTKRYYNYGTGQTCTGEGERRSCY